MNLDQLQGNWKQLKGRARQRWGDLTDNDMDRIQGNSEELIGRVQERYGKSRQDAEKEVREWFNSIQ